MNTLDRIPSEAPGREYFLDWLRIIAFAVLVPYHVGMYYVRWDFHVKSPNLVPGLEPWMMLSSPWRLSLLFIVSGAATSFMLKRGATLPWLASRSKRLLLPLLFGMLLIVPPQPYFEVVQKYGYTGGYLDFLALYFSGYHGFCDAGAQSARCLALPTWNHLWFLPYLWVYTLMAWGLCAAWPRALDRLAALASRALAGAGLLLLPIGAILLARLALSARFPSTHALFGDWFNHVMFGGMFLAGAAFARSPGLWDRMARWRWTALAVALGCWTAGWSPIATLGGAVPAAAWQALYATFQWSALVAVIGFARRHLNVDHRWRRRLVEAVFPVYVLHQTLIIVLSQTLLPLHWRPAIEGPVLIVATFVLSYAGYELARRVRVLRPWLGMPKIAPSDAIHRDAAVAA